MSLQVWLPLNGNLDNIGLSNVIITNNGATVNNNGKIGKCYQYSGSSGSYLDTGWGQGKNARNLSICLWIKPLGTIDSKMAFSTTSTSDSNNKRLYLGVKNNTWSLAYGNSGWGGTSNAPCTVNEWQHLCVTINSSGTAVLYYNGQLTNVSKTYATDFDLLTNIMIAGRETSFNINALVNDVRIYNHCLSKKEVHDIAQALVLHYKLDNPEVLKSKYSNINFNQLAGQYTNNRPNEVSVVNLGQKTRITITSFTNSSDRYIGTTLNNYQTVVGHKYYIGCPCYFTGGFYARYNIGNGWKNLSISNGYPISKVELCETAYTMGNISLGILNQSAPGVGAYIEFYGNYAFKFIDLTQMFGSGNEPTTEEFDLMFPNFFYEYNSGTSLGSYKIVEDSSGYNNNGTITGNLSVTDNTPRHKYATLINDGTSFVLANNPSNELLTLAAWVKTTKNKSTSQMVVGDSLSQICISFYSGCIISYMGSNGSQGTGSKCTLNSAYKENDWNLIVVVKTGTGTRTVYCNGVEQTPTSNDYWSSTFTGFRIGNRSTSSIPFYGYISDIRAYATALSADDILRLYNTSAYIDDAGNTYSYDFDECIRDDSANILLKAEMALCKKQFANGLSNYQQTHCKCTLTDDGYRIYRTPNLTYPDSGSVMWGGFVLDNASNRFGLQKGHTYVVEFDIKGQTTNAVSDMYWTCQVGWGGGECECHPTNIQKMNPVTANYNSSKWRHVSYKFTVSDDVWKECTANYNSNAFVAGNSYVSYRHFKFGFGYTSTGELGTDLYIKNLRMFDITTGESKMNVTANGLIESTYVIENDDNAFVDSFGEMNAKTLVEI